MSDGMRERQITGAFMEAQKDDELLCPRSYRAGYQAALASKPQVTEGELAKMIDDEIEAHDDDVERNLDTYGENLARALLQKLDMRWK